MTVTGVETAGGGEGDGDGLPESAATARMQAVSVNIMAGRGPDGPSTEPTECLLTPGLVIQLPERPGGSWAGVHPGNPGSKEYPFPSTCWRRLRDRNDQGVLEQCLRPAGKLDAFVGIGDTGNLEMLGD